MMETIDDTIWALSDRINELINKMRWVREFDGFQFYSGVGWGC